MTTELDKVKAKIRALSMKTIANGCTEEEALTAMEKVGELLEVYDLTLDEVHLSQEKCVEEKVHLRRRTTPYWAYVFSTIGAFTQTKVWVAKPYVHFFGFEPDVQMAIYLSTVVLNALESETRRFQNTKIYRSSIRRRHQTHSFHLGLIRRLNDRLEQQRPRGKGLVLVKSAKIEDEYRRLNPHMKFRAVPRSRARINLEAFTAGQVAGDRVNLNRPVADREVMYLTR